MLLLDVTPLSLGIEIVGGVFSKVIERNTVIPAKVTKQYTTTTDNQVTVATKVYQGERPLVKDNVLLGKFDLNGIPPAPKGVPQLEVTFEIDANGILKVQALDKASGNSQRISITEHSGRLKDGEIERMVKEAEDFAEGDKKVRERIEARTKFEGYVYNLKNSVKKMKLADVDREEIEETIDEFITWLEDNDQTAEADDYKQKQGELEDIVNPLLTAGGSSRDDDYDHEDL